MSKIPGYPRQMPLRYEKWLPKFTGCDEENPNKHVCDFYSFFQLHPISDNVEDLAMKIFSAALHDNARRWYEDLPDASIATMFQLEEVFLKIWDPCVFLRKLTYINKNKNEIVGEFHDKFKRLLQQILVSHHLSRKFLIFIYTKAFMGQMSFPIKDKSPKKIHGVYNMTAEIKANISSFKEQSFLPEVRACEPKDTPDILKRVPSFEKSIEETLEDLEQYICQQEVKEGVLMNVTNPMGKDKNLLMPLPKITKLWLKSEMIQIL
jgi:hypothetical protein